MKNPVFAVRRLVHSVAVFLACAALLVGAAHAGLDDYPFRVSSLKGDRYTELVARNEGPVTISVHMTMTGENGGSNVSWPLTEVIKPYSSVTLAKIFPRDPAKTSRVAYSMSFMFGDYRAVHSPRARYRLPYPDGSTFRITQAYGDALSTHNERESEHAIDIAMPEGTPIVAARDGIVADVTLQYKIGDDNPKLADKANMVAILHEDGTVALYGHLAARESPVERGQHVKAGSVIGYSGNTGFSSGPHLHFAVTKPQVMRGLVMSDFALPVTFFVDDWRGEFVPRRGMNLKAAYSRPAVAEISKASAAPVEGTLPQQAASTAVLSESSLQPFRQAEISEGALPQPAQQRVMPVESWQASAQSAHPLEAPSAQVPRQSAPQLVEPSNDAASSLLVLALAGLSLGLVLLFVLRAFLRGNSRRISSR